MQAIIYNGNIVWREYNKIRVEKISSSHWFYAPDKLPILFLEVDGDGIRIITTMKQHRFTGDCIENFSVEEVKDNG